VLCCQELGEDVSGDAAVSDENNAPADAAQPPADALEALLAGGAGNLQALLNIPDADDETMVQLAIALSLQDQVCLPLQWLHLTLCLPLLQPCLTVTFTAVSPYLIFVFTLLCDK